MGGGDEFQAEERAGAKAQSLGETHILGLVRRSADRLWGQRGDVDRK